MRDDPDFRLRSGEGTRSSTRRLGPYETTYDTRHGYGDPSERAEPAYAREAAVVFRGRGERRWPLDEAPHTIPQ